MPKGNPNPSPATRFQPGNNRGSHRKVGARERISAAFLENFAADFEQHGPAAIVRMRDEDPSSYVKVAVALQPKEHTHRHVLDGVEDTELGGVIEELKAIVSARAGAMH